MKKNSLPFKILIADDHSLIVNGLKELLIKEFPESNIQTVTSKDTLLDSMRQFKPDILLLDLFLGIHKAHDFFDDLKNLSSHTKIIIVSSNEDALTISHFLKRGVNGFVGKSEDTAMIVLAIKEVKKGSVFTSSELTERLSEGKDSNNFTKDLRLTRREKEVLSELLKEKSNKAIAEVLFISEKTVEHHKANLCVKFDVKNVTGLVKKAIVYGFYE